MATQLDLCDLLRSRRQADREELAALNTTKPLTPERTCQTCAVWKTQHDAMFRCRAYTHGKGPCVDWRPAQDWSADHGQA